jgi:DNA-binding response OmpR family regulator
MRNHSLLIAEDERGIRNFMKQELLAEGYEVVTAEDGAETLLMLSRFEVDLVVLDQHMPLYSGLETAKRIRQRHPNLPIVLFTADDAYENYLGPDIDAAVLKSADLGTLRKAVAKLLAPETEMTHAPHAPITSTWAEVGAQCGG